MHFKVFNAFDFGREVSDNCLDEVFSVSSTWLVVASEFYFMLLLRKKECFGRN